MAKEIYVDQDKLRKGLYALDDTTKAPFGTARIMRNMRITDRGGIAPRLGISRLGAAESGTSPVLNAYVYTTQNGEDEFILKPFSTYIKAYSKNHPSADWWILKSGLTADKEFGFITSLVNTDTKARVIFSNRYDGYFRWTGAVTTLTSARSGGETSLPVASTLDEEILESNTATSNTTTTVGVSGSPWVASQFVGFYVHFLSGTQSGKVSKITANTTNGLTFNALSGAPGNVAFEIRRPLFDDTGTVIYNGTEIAYTAIPAIDTLTVASAHAAPVGTIVAQAVEKVAGAPQGNRMTNYLNRLVVGNVRSGLARNEGGTLQGFASGGSVYVSKVNKNNDFGYSNPRVAGEGDLISMPYGGGNITDVTTQEDAAYVFKARYIEAIRYSQDELDVVIREPLKSGIGSVNRVIKGPDDVYFMTPDKQFTSIGRVASLDITPQTVNIGNTIKRLLETYDVSSFNGIEDQNRVYFCVKSSSDNEQNDKVVVYNRLTDSFEGVWDIPANAFLAFDNELHFASSQGPNIFKMNTGYNDIIDGTDYPVAAQYATHFMNLTPSSANLQSLHSLFFQGYILGESEIIFEGWKDFSDNSFLQFTFSGVENSLLYGTTLMASFGTTELGLSPLGTISDPDPDGRRAFQFRVYFPFQYGNFFSIGWRSNKKDYDYEITKYGLGITEDVSLSKLIKSV